MTSPSEWLRAAGELALPRSCAACHGPNGPVCPACRAHLQRLRFSPGAQRTASLPGAIALPTVWATTPLTGPVRTLISAYKDQDRRDAVPVLAALLACSVRASLVGAPAGRDVWLLPAPTGGRSRRRRGGHPLRTLAENAAELLPDAPVVRVSGALRRVRLVRDQARLDRSARAANLIGSMVLDPRWQPSLTGCTLVLIDDVLTSGATLAEMARALRAGWSPVPSADPEASLRAAVVAVTQRHGRASLIASHRAG